MISLFVRGIDLYLRVLEGGMPSCQLNSGSVLSFCPFVTDHTLTPTPPIYIQIKWPIYSVADDGLAANPRKGEGYLDQTAQRT